MTVFLLLSCSAVNFDGAGLLIVSLLGPKMMNANDS
jgi:hypothetical protein